MSQSVGDPPSWRNIEQGTLTAANTGSTPLVFYGKFALSIWGTFVGVVALQRSPDGGTTWITASVDGTGSPATYSSPIAVSIEEPEYNVLWRVFCTSFSSGAISFRLSQLRTPTI